VYIQRLVSVVKMATVPRSILTKSSVLLKGLDAKEAGWAQEPVWTLWRKENS
jgi:hypothetical protein